MVCCLWHVQIWTWFEMLSANIFILATSCDPTVANFSVLKVNSAQVLLYVLLIFINWHTKRKSKVTFKYFLKLSLFFIGNLSNKSNSLPDCTLTQLTTWWHISKVNLDWFCVVPDKVTKPSSAAFLPPHVTFTRLKTLQLVSLLQRPENQFVQVAVEKAILCPFLLWTLNIKRFVRWFVLC